MEGMLPVALYAGDKKRKHDTSDSSEHESGDDEDERARDAQRKISLGEKKEIRGPQNGQAKTRPKNHVSMPRARSPKQWESESDTEVKDDTLSAAGSDVYLLSELDKDLEDGEKLGPSVGLSLTAVINKKFKKKMSEEKL